jgi:hypothetical protein
MLPAPPPALQAAPTPVFVDDTGRRHRLVRVVGWVVGGLTLAYLTLLGISLVASPGLVPLSLAAIGRVLPGPAAPLIGTATKIDRLPNGQVPPGPIDAPGPALGGPTGPGGGSAAPAGTGESQGTRAATSQPARTPQTGHSPLPAPSAAPSSPSHTPQGNPSPAGTPRSTHSPSAHPSSQSTHGTPHNVKGTPTPSPT